MEWISVKDRLPEDFGQYLGYIKAYGKEWIEEVSFNNFNWIVIHYQLYTNDFAYMYCNITHWMPLPDPPKIKR